MPITEDVEVSYELHRYIIGQKGSGIRKMMEEYEVSSHSLVLWCHPLANRPFMLVIHLTGYIDETRWSVS